MQAAAAGLVGGGLAGRVAVAWVGAERQQELGHRHGFVVVAGKGEERRLAGVDEPAGDRPRPGRRLAQALGRLPDQQLADPHPPLARR